ncbi:MAG TPA: GMC family oxidoreductase [Virgibacillus sp.]|nr:GMC family oxidoreductase [Virgibacillus sp.]
MAKKLDKVDVVVVGVGWAGGIMSAEMAKAGKKVVALERGGYRERDDYVGVKDELKFSIRDKMMQNLSPETITSRTKMDETALPARTRDFLETGTDLGGGGVHWAGATYRYWPYDFEIYSKTVEKYGKDKIPEDMNLQDWGITYDEMEKYYDKWEKTAGISGEQDPLAPERKNEWPNPPLKETPALKLFKDAAKKMDLHPFQIAAGNMSESYENPDGQKLNPCMYCSFCTRNGCDFTAKSDPLATVVPTAMEHDNFELRTESYVRRVLYDKDNSKATGVMYVDEKTGEEYEQPADVVVLSAMAFTNNRLLMLSGIGEPYDPETRKGIIGRNFNGQYNSAFNGARGFFKDKRFNLYMGAGALGAALNDYQADNFDHSDVDFIGGGAIELRQYGDAPIKSSTIIPDDTPTWGKEYKKDSLYYAYRSLVLWYTPVVMSYWHNYLDLDPTYKDEYGDPLIRVTYSFGDNERNIAKFGIEKCHEIMEEMGADIIDDDEAPEEFDNAFTGGHYTGGVVMGDDPDTSAVNTYLQMWDVDNLFVVGGSAFPQHGGHHPTPTICALSYRAAEGVEKYLDEGGQLATAKRKQQHV